MLVLLGLVSGGNWFELSIGHIGPCLGKLWSLEAFCLEFRRLPAGPAWRHLNRPGHLLVLWRDLKDRHGYSSPWSAENWAERNAQNPPTSVAEVGAFTRAGLHPTFQANMCFHRVYVPALHAASSPHTSDFSTAAHHGISCAILLVYQFHSFVSTRQETIRLQGMRAVHCAQVLWGPPNQLAFSAFHPCSGGGQSPS